MLHELTSSSSNEWDPSRPDRLDSQILSKVEEFERCDALNVQGRHGLYEKLVAAAHFSAASPPESSAFDNGEVVALLKIVAAAFTLQQELEKAMSAMHWANMVQRACAFLEAGAGLLAVEQEVSRLLDVKDFSRLAQVRPRYHRQ